MAEKSELGLWFDHPPRVSITGSMNYATNTGIAIFRNMITSTFSDFMK